jgi:O-antigen ligase
MSASLALLAGFAFIYWLLRNEQKQMKVSLATWIPTLWMLYFASKPLARWMNPNGEIDESGSPIDRLFLLVMICLGCVVISKRRLNWRAKWQKSGWLMVVVFYMLVSCLWSESPFGSFKQWVRVLGSAIMPLVLLTEKEPRRAIQSLFLRTVYILIPLSVVLVKYVPDLGVEYRAWNGEKFWVGACLQKNGLGRLCLISGVFLVWMFIMRFKGREQGTWKHQTKIEVLLLFMIGWLLRGPASNYPMTAIAVLVLCAGLLCVLLLVNRAVANPVFAGLAVFTVMAAIAMAFMSVTGIIPSLGVESMGRDATFTGRVDIWAGVRKAASQSPIIGAGYAGYWSKPHEFPNVGIVNEGHNGYLDVYVETGVVGVGLLLVAIASYARKACQERSYDYDWACFRIVFLLMLELHNFTESSLMRSSAHLWVLFIFMFVVFPGPVRRAVNAAKETPKGNPEMQPSLETASNPAG